MAQSFFAEVVRDDGKTITVEYEAEGGEPHFDSPGHICDGGGSGPIITIIGAFDDFGDVKITEAEDERFCEKIAGEHIDEPYDPADDF